MPDNRKPSALQVLLPMLIFAAVGIGLWFLFPNLRTSNDTVGKQLEQETIPPIVVSEAAYTPPRTLPAEPREETRPSAPPQAESTLLTYPIVSPTWGENSTPSALSRRKVIPPGISTPISPTGSWPAKR
ncbi:hypothetical protein [Eikenella longinqua]|uniref:hypothetical protein n=1 Tax=Eikenella longinqua TaxID=1795827 RepID=UPI000A7554BD|nr:hypothetical protein [Eikenella longinqua]